MITFIHLSDIHFINRDHGTQFDLDQQLRRALLDDLERKPADGASYDGVLITGDIAYSGQPSEYKRAQDFLDELCARSGAPPRNRYVVPGNHDIDRRFVSPDLPLWAAHVKLRESTDPVVWNDHIYKQLVKDPHRTLLAPLKAYNDFAIRYDCFTGMVPSLVSGEPDVPQLSWHRVFEKTLDDGTLLRLNGLNSVLVSDEGDAPTKLLVSEFQTAKFEHAKNAVDVVLCHHPPEWLMDKVSIRKALRTYAAVALFGHEHDTRINADDRQVQLFAGAVQPSRRDHATWLPTYPIVQLAVVVGEARRELVVKVHTREFVTDPIHRFRPRRNEHELTVDERRIQLSAANLASMAAVINVDSKENPAIMSEQANDMAVSELKPPTAAETAQRELLMWFFQLPTPQRYEAAFKAGLLRDGDDALDPQVMWAEVFRRAAQENKLAEFWTAIAAHVAAIKEQPNPFIKPTNA